MVFQESVPKNDNFLRLVKRKNTPPLLAPIIKLKLNKPLNSEKDLSRYDVLRKVPT